MNLNDIKNRVKPTLEIEGLWFDRERLNRFVDSKFKAWESYCAENNIDIVPECKQEIAKFKSALLTENKITKKSCNLDLVFGKGVDMRKRAESWLWDYVDF